MCALFKKRKLDVSYRWNQHCTVLIRKPVDCALVLKHKVACFDLDSTLVVPKGKNKFPKDGDDYKFMYPSIVKKLTSLSESQYTLVIFTNQKGISLKEDRCPQFKKRIQGITRALGIPVLVYASLEHDWYRKPCPGMWELFLEEMKAANVDLDVKNSFFVGDAAGRPGDISDSDRKFALNSSLAFYTPEEYFLGESSKPFTLKSAGQELATTKTRVETVKGPEMVILVGMPASGKSTFGKKWFSNYILINQDTLKTREKCLKATKEAIENGESVLVDNTNPDVETRKSFIRIAQSHKIPIRCFVLETDRQLCEHNNMYRSKVLGTNRIPTVAFNVFSNKYQEPSVDEGFSSIQKIKFCPEFIEENHEKIWKMYLT